MVDYSILFIVLRWTVALAHSSSLKYLLRVRGTIVKSVIGGTVQSGALL